MSISTPEPSLSFARKVPELATVNLYMISLPVSLNGILSPSHNPQFLDAQVHDVTRNRIAYRGKLLPAITSLRSVVRRTVLPTTNRRENDSETTGSPGKYITGVFVLAK